MAKTEQTFYYSRRKLGIYLLFNLGLLALAILFTWSVFPNYQPIYYFALITCTLSIISSLFVFLVRLPLAIINEKGIKIDHNQPLKWSQIKSVEKVNLKFFNFDRPLLRITPQRIEHYHKTFMQYIAGNTKFGSFSIPLYAMSSKNASQIEKLINSYMAEHTKKLASKSVVQKKDSAKTNTSKATVKQKSAPKTKKIKLAKSSKKKEL